MARGKSDNPKVLESKKEGASLVSTALDNLPRDAADFRREFVTYADQLEKDKKEAANEHAAHIKSLTERFGTSPFHIATMKKLRGMSTEMRTRELRQLVYALKVLELTDPQLNLFNDAGEAGGLTIEKDDKSVFDTAGNKAAPKTSEREPVKKLTGAEPPAHVPTPGISLDEAKQRFEEANAKGKAARGEKGTPAPEAGKAGGTADQPAGAESAATPKPPASPAKAAATPVPPRPASRSASAAAKSSERRMNRAPTKSEAKAIADKYFKDPAAKEADKNDDDNDHFTGVIH